MSDFLNNALNASDCVASAVATTVSVLHTQTEEKAGKRTNCARRLWFQRHAIYSHSFSLNTFSDFPGLHD